MYDHSVNKIVVTSQTPLKGSGWGGGGGVLRTHFGYLFLKEKANGVSKGWAGRKCVCGLKAITSTYVHFYS